jgi:hypothetical protein
MATPMVYRIHVGGHLGPEWTEWFDNMTNTLEPNDDTILSRPVADQPALHGLPFKVRDLELTLVSVDRVQGVD